MCLEAGLGAPGRAVAGAAGGTRRGEGAVGEGQRSEPAPKANAVFSFLRSKHFAVHSNLVRGPSSHFTDGQI